MITASVDTTETTPGRPTPPSAERADLLESLQAQRGFLLHTVQGLTDEQARLRPTVSELSLGGLVKHVAATGRVWVDFVLEETSGRATVLEINPRPTTSHVALAWHLTPGVLARAWLGLVAGIPGESGRNLAEFIHSRAPARFSADGTIDIGDSRA